MTQRIIDVGFRHDHVGCCSNLIFREGKRQDASREDLFLEFFRPLDLKEYDVRFGERINLERLREAPAN